MSEDKVDGHAIRGYLPHRYPFLFVDSVELLEVDKRIIAYKNVTHNEPYFQGHFPSQPVMPGVIMIETLAQVAGVLMAKSLNWPFFHDNVCFLAGIDKARFKKVVQPGDVLKLEVEVLKARRELWRFSGVACVEGQLACSAELMVVKKDKKEDEA